MSDRIWGNPAAVNKPIHTCSDGTQVYLKGQPKVGDGLFCVYERPADAACSVHFYPPTYMPVARFKTYAEAETYKPADFMRAVIVCDPKEVQDMLDEIADERQQEAWDRDTLE